MKVFDSVAVKKPSMNVFNLSHDVKSSYTFDFLYPFMCRPVYPGDTWNCRAEVFMRAMPLIAPVMHNVDMFFYFFFVPNRLIWNANKKQDWKTFITGGEDGLANPALPYWTYSQFNTNALGSYTRHGSLIDHMGFPSMDWTGSNHPHTSRSTKVSALPFRAYQLVWNEYFRNQNVQNEIEFDYGAGQVSSSDIANLFTLRKKCWEKDYFTSCLPWAQRGQAMTLPISGTPVISGTAPVVVNSIKTAAMTFSDGLSVAQAGGTGSNAYVSVGVRGVSADTNYGLGDAVQLEGTANLSNGSITFTGLSIGTINDFRYCLRLQQWLENNARCGSRYIEQLFSHFGVTSSDARLQRPELLGGGKVPLIFTDIPQTSSQQTAGDTVLGDLGGKGTLYGKTAGFKKYFEEHGILLGLCCIIPRTSYSQGIPREWTAFHRTDFYFPEFAHLGEQAVLNKELYFPIEDQVSVVQDEAPDDVFGYQGRFTELRYIPSSVHGEMRKSLAFWHFGRLFTTIPHLNSSFVEAQTDPRCFAMLDVSSGEDDPLVCQIHLDVKAVRPLPKYAIPTL